MFKHKMNCPKCGLRTLPDQKFCRSCGYNLQIITRPLGEIAGVSDLQRTSEVILRDETPRANRLTLYAFVIMFIGVAVGVIGKMLIHEDVITVAVVLIFVAGMFFTVYPPLSPSPRRKLKSIASSPPEIPAQSQYTRYLLEDSNIEYVAGITERTTDLLNNSSVTKTETEKG